MGDEVATHYAIYDHPKDYPDDFVVRRWRIVPGRAEPIPEKRPFALTRSLDEARQAIPPGLVRILPAPNDDPVIVETWI